MLALICDGKIFVGTHEHSADTPLYKGEQVKALNATDGTEIWTLSSWGYPETFATADGVLIYWNNYDAQVYAIGKGPTQMTITAPDVGVTTSTPITIRGTIMDVSAGTQQTQQKADFPNGVPAVSDASQSAWMAYVYMQKGMPTNTTGVPVPINVVDSNGNYRTIGTTTTSGEYGTYRLTWKPDISGNYTIIATFAGSGGYYASSAETYMYVSPPAPTTAPTAAPVTGLATMSALTYGVVAVIIVIIIAIAIVGLLLLRKKP